MEAEASLPDPKHSVTEVPEGTIFEELVVQYGKLAERAEDMIVQCVCGEIEAGLRAHFTSGSSTSVTLLHPDCISLNSFTDKLHRT